MIGVNVCEIYYMSDKLSNICHHSAILLNDDEKSMSSGNEGILGLHFYSLGARRYTVDTESALHVLPALFM